MLHEVGDGLWEQHQDLTVFGANIGTRMNLMKTQNGLCIHSPIQLTAEIKSAIEDLGLPVTQVIAPNLFHHMFVKDYLEQFPTARFYTIPDLAKRRPDLTEPIMIEEGSDQPWSKEVEHFIFRGGRWFQEVIFFHKASQTLILTDFAFNLHDTGSWIFNGMLKLSGCYGRFGQTALERLLIRDKPKLKEACERILQWDFRRISVAHGPQVEERAREVFLEGLSREVKGLSRSD